MVTIGTENDVNSLRERLTKRQSVLCKQGLMVQLAEKTWGKLTLLSFEFNSDSQDLMRYHLASALTDLIIEDLEVKLLEGMLINEHQLMHEEDRKEIICLAQHMINVDQQLVNWRYSHILTSTLNYLGENNVLVIGGFIRFRLQGYLERLRGILDQAINEYCLLQDYKEFMHKISGSLLEKKDHLDVIIREGETLVLANVKDINPYWLADGVSVLDFLFNLVMLMTPVGIKIHLPGQNELRFMQALRRLEDLQFCTGCSLCLPDSD